MTESSPPPQQAAAPWQRRLAWAWLALMLLVLGHNAWLWGVGTERHLQIDTDVLAMLPQDPHDALTRSATERMASAAARRVIVLIGGQDWEQAKSAADRYAAVLQDSGQRLNLRYKLGDGLTQAWLDFYKPYQNQLITDELRQQLQTQSPASLAQRALQALYQPLNTPRVGSWREDPLNAFGAWLAQRAGASPVRVTQARMSVQQGDAHWAFLTLEQSGSAFSLADQRALLPVLERARAAALNGAPGARVLTGGVPLFAAAAANQAEHEIHTIGLGSLLGVVMLTWFAFSSLRPRILVTLSIALGLLTAVSVAALVFGRVHLITLVFGASLVGVAENYGTNYFCARLGYAPPQRWHILRRQLPIVGLAMLTTVIGYALLAWTPFPGLRQIAVFSAAGLLASFVTVVLWFVFLDVGQMPFTRFAQWLGSRRALWPSLTWNRYGLGGAAIVLAILLVGAWQATSNDDIRTLQNAPPTLLAEQRQLGELLKSPAVAQFFVVQGANAQQVLEREEQLKAQLDTLQMTYQALSDWVPSLERQRSNAQAMQAVLEAPGGVIEWVGQQTGQIIEPVARRVAWLGFEDWLAAPVSEPFRHQWLGQMGTGSKAFFASAVLLRDVDVAKTARLSRVSIPGVRWVDKVAEVSDVMGRTRHVMLGVLLVSYALVWAALAWRFGTRAWRALLPTALASALALALIALSGQALQLFHVLPLLIILGLGVDYGIFMLEQPERDGVRPFLSVTLAAASTLLSFGLLALSGTAALHAFGLTMLLGVSLAWLLTPLFLPSNHAG